jgi:CubicO group peptidase (beta-lactamase class C family)
MTRWKRGLVAGTATILAGAAFVWMATWVMDVPNPVLLLSLGLTRPSAIGLLFASRGVPASESPRTLQARALPWPAEILWKGARISVVEFLRRTNTRAFDAMRQGVIIAEWYDRDTDARTPLASWSVAKSIVSLLVGQSIAAGHLQETARLVDLLPDLRRAGADPRITVRDLLDMTSGINVPETYDAWRFWRGTTGMYLTRNLPEFEEQHVALQFVPGSRGVYRSIDTQLLGRVLSIVEQRSLASILSEWLWTPIGAEQPASWNLDRPGGVEKAFCCINAVARDFARIGQLVLDDGRVGDRQVIPAEWIARLMKPAALPRRIPAPACDVGTKSHAREA